MSYCTPCPPCDTQFPLLCEPLETTTQASRLVVEDTAACQKTLQTPSSSQEVLKSVGGKLSWTTGGNNSLLTKDNNGFIELRNGSVSEPITLPSIAQHAASSVPSQLVMLSDGTVKVWEPSLTADKYVAYWDGSNWVASTLTGILPSGNGVFFRDTAGALQVATAGVSGSTLQMVGSNIQFVAAGPNQLPQGYIYGLTMLNNAASGNDTIDVAEGRCRNTANTSDLLLSATMVKNINANWTAGTNEGGLDVGVKASNSTYHVFAIGNGVAFDVIFSLNSVVPAVPDTSYTSSRRIGSFTTDSVGNIRLFKQIGDRFLYFSDVTVVKPIASQSAVAVGIGGSIFTLNGIPSDIIVKPLFVASITANVQWAVFEAGQAYPSTQIPAVNNTGTNYLRQGTSTSVVTNTMELYTNTSRQIGVDVSAAVAAGATGLYIDVYGWVDDRGKTF
jgi:hypothetical protein